MNNKVLHSLTRGRGIMSQDGIARKERLWLGSKALLHCMPLMALKTTFQDALLGQVT